MEVPDNRTGIVIELKYAENGNMDTACEEALKQIEDRITLPDSGTMACVILLNMELPVTKRIARWYWDNHLKTSQSDRRNFHE